jgi:hypothetical protein
MFQTIRRFPVLLALAHNFSETIQTAAMIGGFTLSIPNRGVANEGLAEAVVTVLKTFQRDMT